MSVKIHHIVTGEVESNLQISLLNSGSHPDIPHDARLPMGLPGTVTHLDGSVHDGMMVPVPVWLIEGSDKTILVDTGLGDVDEVMGMQARYGADWTASRSRDGSQDIVAGLARHGVQPDDIDVVVLTHLHYDHIGNNELFSRAEFIVQRSELSPADNPPSFCMFYYPEYRYKMDAIRQRLTVIDGDFEVAGGIRLVKIGGHTPGCQVVMVETEAGLVCLTSDVMYNYRNLELNWPTGSFWDLPELIDGYQRIRAEADIVVPEHDWEFLTHHPTGTIG